MLAIRSVVVPVLISVAVLVAGCQRAEKKGTSVLKGLSGEIEDLNAGEAAYDFELKDVSGRKHKLSDYRGKLVLLNFWATWCTPCITEMPALETLQSRFDSERFVVLTISVDAELEVLEEFIANSNLELLVLHDPTMKAIAKYSVEGFPESVFVDAEGNLLAVKDPVSKTVAVRILSDRPWEDERYTALVKSLLNEGPA